MRMEEPCPEHASFSAEYAFSNGHTLVLELCSEHLPKAQRAAEIYSERKLREPAKVISVRFDQINADYKPRSEAAINELPASQ
jgi:hypothetical protein